MESKADRDDRLERRDRPRCGAERPEMDRMAYEFGCGFSLRSSVRILRASFCHPFLTSLVWVLSVKQNSGFGE